MQKTVINHLLYKFCIHTITNRFKSDIPDPKGNEGNMQIEKINNLLIVLSKLQISEGLLRFLLLKIYLLGSCDLSMLLC